MILLVHWYFYCYCCSLETDTAEAPHHSIVSQRLWAVERQTDRDLFKRFNKQMLPGAGTHLLHCCFSSTSATKLCSFSLSSRRLTHQNLDKEWLLINRGKFSLNKESKLSRWQICITRPSQAAKFTKCCLSPPPQFLFKKLYYCLSTQSVVPRCDCFRAAK